MLTWKYAKLLDVVILPWTHLYKTEREKKGYTRHREIESKFVHLHVFFPSPPLSTKLMT